MTDILQYHHHVLNEQLLRRASNSGSSYVLLCLPQPVLSLITSFVILMFTFLRQESCLPARVRALFSVEPDQGSAGLSLCAGNSLRRRRSISALRPPCR